jgi:L-2-hydroxyglutarate oxidase LhgO
MSDSIPITIIGGGVCGCAVAWEISRRFEGPIALLERNAKIRGENQSSRNSGVIHAGIYYPRDKEPRKARFCVEGNRLLYGFCEEHGIPHQRTGKLVVATSDLEMEYLDDVERIAQENGVPGIERIDGRRARELEPNVNASEALYFPTSGIIDAAALVGTLHRLAESNGVMTATANEVVDVRTRGSGFQVISKVKNLTETIETDRLINAAGLYSDVIARMVNPDSPYRIAPVRGESAKFYRTRRDTIAMNGMNVYPVPVGHYPGGRRLNAPFAEFQRLYREGRVAKTTGVHLTPTLDIAGDEVVVGDTVTIGPAYAVGEVDREDYAQTVELSDYLEQVRPYFPGLELGDIGLHQAGINAKLYGISDFVVERDSARPNCIHLLGINSPGLTSSLAIARYVADLLE